MDAAQARAVGRQLVEFLETGTVADGLFHPDVFLDLSMPTWRIQASGADDLVKVRLDEHRGTSTVTRWRTDPIPSGLVLEFEERWEQDGQRWYGREMMRAEVTGSGITELTVYCTGDWDQARQDEHGRTVSLIRP